MYSSTVQTRTVDKKKQKKKKKTSSNQISLKNNLSLFFGEVRLAYRMMDFQSTQDLDLELEGYVPYVPVKQRRQDLDAQRADRSAKALASLKRSHHHQSQGGNDSSEEELDSNSTTPLPNIGPQGHTTLVDQATHLKLGGKYDVSFTRRSGTRFTYK